MKKKCYFILFVFFFAHLRSHCEDPTQMTPIYHANAALGFSSAQGNYNFWTSHVETIATITMKSRRLTEDALGLSDANAKNKVGKIRLTFNTTEGRLRIEACGDESVLTARFVNTLASHLLVEYAKTFNMKMYSIHPANPQMPKFPIERVDIRNLATSDIVFDIQNPNPNSDDHPEEGDSTPKVAPPASNK